MPIRRIGPSAPHQYPEISARLVQELRNPKEEEATHEDPFIIEETIGQGPLKHILVIWDRWKDVPMDERGGIVMDAYEQNFGPGTTQNITLAMALTYEEAANLKIGPSDLWSEERISPPHSGASKG